MEGSSTSTTTSSSTTTAASDQLRFVVTPRIRKALALATSQFDANASSPAASASKETREALRRLHKDKSANEVPLGLLRELSRVLVQIKSGGSAEKTAAVVVEHAYLHELLHGSQPVVARPPPPPKKVPHSSHTSPRPSSCLADN
jgi:hypothetical protein